MDKEMVDKLKCKIDKYFVHGWIMYLSNFFQFEDYIDFSSIIIISVFFYLY